MTKIRPVLGRGLESLIPRPMPLGTIAPPAGRQDDGTGNEIIVNIDLDKIEKNPYQPRAEFDPVTLDELKRSIQEKGIIQPITVHRVNHGYQLISGERRVRAAREAGMTQIPAYIIRIRSNEEMLELALIENLQREHLNPIEIAISYKRLMDECSFTQEQVSQKIGKDRSTITNSLRLLKLPEIIQAAVRKGDVSTGHARALIAIEDKPLQMGIFQKILDKGISVREVERLVREQGRHRERRVHAPGSDTNSSFASVEERLRQKLSTKVQVRMLHDGKGEIVIEYYSAEDLERLLELIESAQV
jgi:ParB family transcriptional regulator, chromosome partitioning protein